MNARHYTGAALTPGTEGSTGDGIATLAAPSRAPRMRALPAVTAALLAACVGVFGAAAVRAQPATPEPAGRIEQRVSAALADIRARDGQYRAVIAVDPAAVSTARELDASPDLPGILHGEPILLKDNIESLGLPTTAGSLALADNDTGRDAPLVAQLRAAGAVILGKTNLSEWANFRSEHSISGWSAVGGQARNAVDRARSPCGSSSGSGAAVALGYVDVAIGTETSGSIVCPAAINGVVGFKPTHGLVSAQGIVPISASQDTAGPIARDVGLAARTLAAMLDPGVEAAATIRSGLQAVGEDLSLAGVRIGVYASTQGYDTRRDEQLAAVIRRAEEAGAVIVPDLELERYADFGQDTYDVLLYEFRRDLNAYLAGLPNDYSALTLEKLIRFNEEHASRELRFFDQSIFHLAQNIDDSEEEYLAKHRASRAAMREDGLDRLFAEHQLDVMIGITAGPAWMIDTVNGDAWFGRGMAQPAAIAGNPHITLPLAKVAHLPLGISLYGRRWEDHELARIAAALEALH